MPVNLSDTQTRKLLRKLEQGDALTADELEKLRMLIDSMATAIRVQNLQLEAYELKDAWTAGNEAAASAARATALNALRAVADPVATINVDDAITEVQNLRSNIEQAKKAAQITAAAAKFAIRLASAIT